MIAKKTPNTKVISIDKIIEERYDSPYISIKEEYDPYEADEEYAEYTDHFENEESPWDDDEEVNDRAENDYLKAKHKINHQSISDLRNFASDAMAELEKNGLEDFVLLKNDKLREWWAAEKRMRTIKEERAREKERIAEVKKLAKERYDHMMSTFTAEEKKLLGIK